jgi:hypothetical protein
MLKNLVSTLILLFSSLTFVRLASQDTKFRLDSGADLVVETTNHGTLEAYKSVNNDSQWAALGRARLIKKEKMSSYLEIKEMLVFFLFLNFSLTNEMREALAAKAREKYAIKDIRASQIVDMPMTKLGCKFETSNLSFTANANRSQLNQATPIGLFFAASRINEMEKKKHLENAVLKCKMELYGQLLARFTLDVSSNQLVTSESDEFFNEIQKLKLEIKRTFYRISNFKDLFLIFF